MGAVLASSFRRLHIAPFTAELEDRIIAPSIKPFAREISFHAKPTFPERAFGFVELPEMEAEKLKKKLNGSTLRGQKVRVQDARPERKRKSDDDEEDEGSGQAKKVARRDKKKREEGVLPGVEMEEGRSVKRGWTGEAEDGKSSKGKGKQSKPQAGEDAVEGKKLRFKTTVPPNTSAPEEGTGKQKKGSKSKKNVVVEEFGKSKTVLVISGEDRGASHGELSYEDGKGWIDEGGSVVEAERQSKRPSRRRATKEAEPIVGATESTESNDFALADGMAIDNEAAESSKPEANDPTAQSDEAEAAKEVHPLEALFKRPTSSSSASAKSRPKPINTSFSFFDAGAGDGDGNADMEGVVPPKTPNTRRDLEWRSIRSAAPTPDTAAIDRKFSFPFASGDDDEDEDDSDDADMDDANQAESGATQGPSQGDGEESSFRKWFYEHRGEFNRGWKKRRREEKKAKRQMENRRLSRRVA